MANALHHLREADDRAHAIADPPRWDRRLKGEEVDQGCIAYKIAAHAGGVARGLAESKAVEVDDLNETLMRHVRRIYQKYGENMTRAAQALNVTRSTLRKYLKTN